MIHSKTIDCACVIHGAVYDWIYVQRLHNMLVKNLPQHKVKLHVFTEESRSVPNTMVKHVLTEWSGITGPKKSWWYKMQLFNAEQFDGNLLYFDLDTVIVRDITWIVELNPINMWTVRDFVYLQKPNFYAMNSSIMWWNVGTFDWVWKKFKKQGAFEVMKQHRSGDQEYLNKILTQKHIRYFDQNSIQSWRWQAKDGGMIFPDKKYRTPGIGTQIDNEMSVLVFHGDPKPHQVTDPIIKQLWC